MRYKKRLQKQQYANGRITTVITQVLSMLTRVGRHRSRIFAVTNDFARPMLVAVRQQEELPPHGLAESGPPPAVDGPGDTQVTVPDWNGI